MNFPGMMSYRFYRKILQKACRRYRNVFEARSGKPVGEADGLNRPFTAKENERCQALTEEYERIGRFPEGFLTVIANADSYSGQGVAVDASTRSLYLPEGSLDDEELLGIIDYNHKMTYSIYEENSKACITGFLHEGLL